MKCPASGEAERNHWPNLERLRADRDEVVRRRRRADWEYAVEVIKRYDLETAAKAILISPSWGDVELERLAEWVAHSRLEIRMQLQMHKYIWGPDVHGV